MNPIIDNQKSDAQILALKEQIQVLRQRLPFYQLEREARQSPAPHAFESHIQRHSPKPIPQICLQQISNPSQLQKRLSICADYPTLIIDLGSRALNPDLPRAYQDLTLIRKTLPQHFLIIRDQIVDEYQILRARLAGADGLILSLAELGHHRSKIYANKLRLWSMEPILIVKTVTELEALTDLPTRCVWLDPASNTDRTALLQHHLATSFFWNCLSVVDKQASRHPSAPNLISPCSLWQTADPLQELRYLHSLYQNN